MSDLPSATVLNDARSIVSTWDACPTPIDKLAAELVALCVANLSRRRPDGWTERDLLTETTLQQHRFDRDLLRDGPLVERFTPDEYVRSWAVRETDPALGRGYQQLPARGRQR